VAFAMAVAPLVNEETATDTVSPLSVTPLFPLAVNSGSVEFNHKVIWPSGEQSRLPKASWDAKARGPAVSQG